MALFGKPRIIGLVEVASRAELLRRKRQVRGVALRVALVLAAVVFALLMLLWLHSAAWAALAGPLGPVGGAALVVAIDLVLCLGLGWYATRGQTNAGADEAVAVRNTALRGAQLELETLGGLLHGPGDDHPAPRKGRVRVYPP